MLSRFKLHHSKRHQPPARIGHRTTVINEKIYLWGGWEKSFPKTHTSAEKVKLTSVVDVFNFRTGEWSQLPTSGIPPLGVAFYSCASIGEDIYYFGGRCGHDACHHNTLHRLSTITMRWRDITPTSYTYTGPMKKAQCGMAAFRFKNEDCLFIVGGYGQLPPSHQPQAIYQPKRAKPEYGWTNEVHLFSMQSGAWTTPEMLGEAPPPCSNFTFTAISHNRAILFGGFQPESDRLSHVYMADLCKESVFWSKLPSSSDSVVRAPGGTCDHSACFLPGIFHNGTHPMLAVVGGEDNRGRALSDCWLLNIRLGVWKQLDVPITLGGRLYHSLSALTMGPRCVWLVAFGGVREMEDSKDWQDQPMVTDTTVIELVMRDDKEWSVSVVMDSTMLVTSDEYQRKIGDRLFQGRKEWVELNSQATPSLPADEEHACALKTEELADRDQAKQMIVQGKQEMNKERKDSRNLYDDLTDARKRASVSDEQARQSRDDLLKVRNELKQVQVELADANRKIDELEHSAQTSPSSNGKIPGELMPHWIIDRDDLVMVGKNITSGSKDRVRIAEYRGVRVAVETLQKVREEELIFSLKMASNLRHPNIVLFMGASMEKDPMVVSEHIPSNIRQQLDKGPLGRVPLASIARDVASALLYLHLYQPDPIIHGALSSSAVMLERIDGGWRAKLARCGVTLCLEHPVDSPYSAPESGTLVQLVPCCDVFSFGVLLLEMQCRDAPSSTTAVKEKQLQRVNWAALLTLIRKCTAHEPSNRLSMSEVVQELKQM